MLQTFPDVTNKLQEIWHTGTGCHLGIWTIKYRVG